MLGRFRCVKGAYMVSFAETPRIGLDGTREEVKGRCARA
jgi:hypothetical protein